MVLDRLHQLCHDAVRVREELRAARTRHIRGASHSDGAYLVLVVRAERAHEWRDEPGQVLDEGARLRLLALLVGSGVHRVGDRLHAHQRFEEAEDVLVVEDLRVGGVGGTEVGWGRGRL